MVVCSATMFAETFTASEINSATTKSGITVSQNSCSLETQQICKENSKGVKESIINTTTVIAAKLEDRVGALCYVLDFLAQAEVNIEYIYAFTASEDFGAYVVIRVDDAQKAEEVLKAHNIPTLCEDDIKDI